MSRGRLFFTSKNTLKMQAILELIIDRHEAGYSVITGAEEWPSVEDFRILKFCDTGGDDLGVRVQSDSRQYEQERYYSQFTCAEDMAAFIDRYGGPKRIAEATADYSRYCAEDAQILRELGSRGIHRTIEDIAARHYMDVKTIKARKDRALRSIAYYCTHYDDIIEAQEYNEYA